MPLNNSQYNELMRNYSRRRFAHMNELEEKLAGIYKRSPELEETISLIQTASAELTRANILSSPDLDARRAHLQQLREKKSQLLSGLGLSENDLLPRYTCPDCKDTGFIGTEKCHCLRQAEIDLLYTQSNLKKVLSAENFQTFSLDYYEKEINPLIEMSNFDYMRKVVSQCYQYARNFSSGSANIIFTGNAGVGKSFLTHCIAAEVLNGCNSVMSLTAVELFEKIAERRRSFEDEDLPSDADYIMDCDLLIIDDLGSETVTQYRVSQFFYCLNERLVNQKPTIISTNLAINQLREIYTERIASRIIANFTVYPIYGRDIRFLKKFGIVG